MMSGPTLADQRHPGTDSRYGGWDGVRARCRGADIQSCALLAGVPDEAVGQWLGVPSKAPLFEAAVE